MKKSAGTPTSEISNNDSDSTQHKISNGQPLAKRPRSHAPQPPAISDGTATVTVAEMDSLLTSLIALKNGDFTARMPVTWTGLAGKIADTFNTVIERNQKMASELARLSQVVG